MSAFRLPAKDRKTVVANMEEVQRTLWAVAGMTAVLKRCDGEELGDMELQSFAEAMELLLSPTYQAVEEGIKELKGEPID